jgi:hypothetical protein
MMRLRQSFFYQRAGIMYLDKGCAVEALAEVEPASLELRG